MKPIFFPWHVAFFLMIWDPAPVHAAIQSIMPPEHEPHEGTWLSWPHHYTYGQLYRDDIESTWVAMTKALVTSENVHIIAYNNWYKNRIIGKLRNAGVPLARVDFYIIRTDDTWVRDNGPMFVRSTSGGSLKILDWGFNGWGRDAPFTKDNQVPAIVANKIGVSKVWLNDVILEGGAVEIDGRGTLMATRSSVLQNKRNENLTQLQMERVLTRFMGVTNFIWLNGKNGGKEDITDYHIDGFARFGDGNTIVTMSNSDLLYWGISQADINILANAKDKSGNTYRRVVLPLTKNNVRTTYGKNLGYKGSYVNYYTANKVVLVPSYNDPNDSVARNRLQQLYPGKEMVSIDVRNLYREGGMVHCVTQQQPA